MTDWEYIEQLRREAGSGSRVIEQLLNAVIDLNKRLEKIEEALVTNQNGGTRTQTWDR
jgi:hypothetical protein